ncbi:MAG TPA: NrfD/PsrC family molybdoenzyme membrane anchor subunit [Acidimicrobiales bacterium]|nr:NrfD/PsrC family molybdoenzyme membrane anchor subunit [Acidimicrobiales bacterium]
MVPDATPRSYYGLPVISQPVWKSRDIAGYFFLGGLAGASSTLALGAQLTGRPGLARSSRLAAAGAIGLSAAALVHDLGRPERFYNMLRVFKPTSPMSVGSWLLAAYGPMAVTAAGTAATGLRPGLGTAASAGAALLGPAVASYTGVLVSDTAVPAWHEGHRHMPYLFASSAASAAGGLGLVAAPRRDNGPARRMGVAGAAGELALFRIMRQSMGRAGRAYTEGRAHRWTRRAETLTLAGLVGAAVGARRSRVAAALSGSALLAGSACTRWAVFEAGLQSARDPDDTVIPQRERLRRRPGPDG